MAKTALLESVGSSGRLSVHDGEPWQAAERGLPCVCIGRPRERAAGTGHQQEQRADTKRSDTQAPQEVAAPNQR